MPDLVLDANGREVKIGMRVAPYFHKGEMTCPGGVVTQVTEAEGDIDDYGRSIQIGPEVTVRYDDGEEDSYLAYYQWNSNEFICDDVEVEVEP